MQRYEELYIPKIRPMWDGYTDTRPIYFHDEQFFCETIYQIPKTAIDKKIQTLSIAVYQ